MKNFARYQDQTKIILLFLFGFGTLQSFYYFYYSLVCLLFLLFFRNYFIILFDLGTLQSFSFLSTILLPKICI